MVYELYLNISFKIRHTHTHKKKNRGESLFHLFIYLNRHLPSVKKVEVCSGGCKGESLIDYSFRTL